MNHLSNGTDSTSTLPTALLTMEGKETTIDERVKTISTEINKAINELNLTDDILDPVTRHETWMKHLEKKSTLPSGICQRKANKRYCVKKKIFNKCLSIKPVCYNLFENAKMVNDIVRDVVEREKHLIRMEKKKADARLKETNNEKWLSLKDEIDRKLPPNKRDLGFFNWSSVPMREQKRRRLEDEQRGREQLETYKTEALSTKDVGWWEERNCWKVTSSIFGKTRYIACYNDFPDAKNAAAIVRQIVPKRKEYDYWSNEEVQKLIQLCKDGEYVSKKQFFDVAVQCLGTRTRVAIELKVHKEIPEWYSKMTPKQSWESVSISGRSLNEQEDMFVPIVASPHAKKRNNQQKSDSTIPADISISTYVSLFLRTLDDGDDVFVDTKDDCDFESMSIDSEENDDDQKPAAAGSDANTVAVDNDDTAVSTVPIEKNITSTTDGDSLVDNDQTRKYVEASAHKLPTEAMAAPGRKFQKQNQVMVQQQNTKVIYDADVQNVTAI